MIPGKLKKLFASLAGIFGHPIKLFPRVVEGGSTESILNKRWVFIEVLPRKLGYSVLAKTSGMLGQGAFYQDTIGHQSIQEHVSMCIRAVGDFPSYVSTEEILFVFSKSVEALAHAPVLDLFHEMPIGPFANVFGGWRNYSKEPQDKTINRVGAVIFCHSSQSKNLEKFGVIPEDSTAGQEKHYCVTYLQLKQIHKAFEQIQNTTPSLDTQSIIEPLT